MNQIPFKLPNPDNIKLLVHEAGGIIDLVNNNGVSIGKFMREGDALIEKKTLENQAPSNSLNEQLRLG